MVNNSFGKTIFITYTTGRISSKFKYLLCSLSKTFVLKQNALEKLIVPSHYQHSIRFELFVYQNV